MGYYYSASPIEAVTLPVKINVVFLGFDGDGNNFFKLTKEDMVDWFHHFEHVVQHVTVPVGEDQTTTEKFETPKSHIKYNFDVEVIKLSPLVNTLIEDTILWNIRPEVPLDSQKEKVSEKGEVYYVDAYKISSVLAHLADYLQLNQYTLFVLNPKKTASEHVYGYRTGFSEGELTRIKELGVLKNVTINLSQSSTNSNKGTWTKSDSTSQQEKLTETLTLRDLVSQSESWAKEFIQEQYKDGKNGQEEREKARCKNGEEDDPSCLFYRKRPEEYAQPIELHIEEMLNDELMYELKYLQKIQKIKVHSECLVENWVSHRRFAFLDLSAGPFSWGPIVSGEGVKTKTSLPLVPPHFLYEEFKETLEKEKHDDHEQSALDREFLRAFFSKYCNSDLTTPHPKCKELGEKVKLLAYTDEKMSIKEITELIYTHEDEKSSPDDSFLSQLGAILSSSLRHLITPPTPLYESIYYPRLIFEFYVIANHQVYEPLKEFNYEEFKQEINKFKLPDQEFIFNLKTISMIDDQALAVGFMNSLKTVVLPKLTVSGEFSTFPQTYLDSKEMRRQLQLQGVLSDDKSNDEDTTPRSKQIPIFLFSLDSDEPLFIDKYYQSKSLSDMVVIIQTNVVDYPSKVSCNSEPIYWNLRSPLKSSLSATVLNFGGLITTHITYNEARKSADQNWLWSVSDSPVSYTNSGHKFSLINVDIVQRNYVVNTLEKSINIVNQGVDVLMSIKTNSFQRDPELDLLPNSNNLTSALKSLHSTYKVIAGHIRKLEFNLAIRQLPNLMIRSKKFRDSCYETISVLELLRCIDPEDTTPITEQIDWIFPIALCVDILLVLVITFILKTRKPKAKIN